MISDNQEMRSPPDPQKLWCLKPQMARKPLMINVVQIETRNLGLNRHRRPRVILTP